LHHLQPFVLMEQKYLGSFWPSNLHRILLIMLATKHRNKQRNGKRLSYTFLSAIIKRYISSTTIVTITEYQIIQLFQHCYWCIVDPEGLLWNLVLKIGILRTFLLL
jgi:hypothetical protein